MKYEKTQTRKLVELTETLQFEQIIKEPTRTTETSCTLIDLFGVSDHSLIYIHRKISIPRTQPRVIHTRQYKHYNVGEFRYDLMKKFQTQADGADPNIIWNDWKAKFLAVADTHAPCIYHGDFLKKAVKTGSKKVRNELNKLVKKLMPDTIKML